jgi:hypothetical protein
MGAISCHFVPFRATLDHSFPAGQASARFLEEAWALGQENSLPLSLPRQTGKRPCCNVWRAPEFSTSKCHIGVE